jgi:hypothetical protein
MDDSTLASKKSLPNLISRLQKLDEKINAMVVMGKALPMLIISSFLVLGGVSYLAYSTVSPQTSLDTLPLTGGDAQVIFTTADDGKTIPINRNDSITIEISSEEDLAHGEVHITFNPEVIDMREPFIYTTLAVSENITLERDRIIISFQTLQPTTSLRGEFAKISFNTIATGSVDLLLDEDKTELFNNQNQPLSFSSAFSQYRVE